MKIEIAQHDRMSESGSSLLRLIQNQSIPLLDLLVRESTQNSLDAAKEGEEKVSVEYTVGKFQSSTLNQYFDVINKRLDEKFPDSNGPYSFISVRDKNTYGLTGPVKYEDIKNNQFGNLLKLVYEICKPQQNEGAGGSWGLGKTIYFRLGIGLVIYYSRIFQDGKYSSRLAACLVENELKDDSLIPDDGGLRRGIAWWGKKTGFTGNKTIPVTDEKEIDSIISVFGIKPYKNDETGTTIIIPYINEQALLGEVYAHNINMECKPYWVNDIAGYLRVAVQRWYAPRLSNRYYKYGAYLSARVCGKKITVSEMLPLFRLIRELYIISEDTELESDSLAKSENINFSVEDINLRKVFTDNSVAGKFVYTKLNTKQLLMEAPDNNKSPYQQITNFPVPMEGGNTPIVMYTRQPGMIVGYDYDSAWTHRMPKSGESEYIIGLFVLNSKNHLKEIKNPYSDTLMTLEEYIRQGENADHASWTDRNINGNDLRIVSSTQKLVIKKIASKYKEKAPENVVKKNIPLGHALADMLLPSLDFGHAPSISGGSRGGSGIPTKHSSFRIIGEPVYIDGSISLEYELFLRKEDVKLRLLVSSDYKKYESRMWENDEYVGNAFPLSLLDFSIKFSKGKVKKAEKTSHNLSVSDKGERSAEDDTFSIEMMSSERYSVTDSVRIHSEKSSLILNGRIKFRSDDPGIKGILDLKEV